MDLEIKESDLINIIKRTINESHLLLEKKTCKNDNECPDGEMCAKHCNPEACCIPICRGGAKNKDCGPLSIMPDDYDIKQKEDIAERYDEDYPPSDTGKAKYYCVMKGRPCWHLEERDPAAKGHEGYKSEKKCNKNC